MAEDRLKSGSRGGGGLVSSGTYFVRLLHQGKEIGTRKLALIR